MTNITRVLTTAIFWGAVVAIVKIIYDSKKKNN